jgi:uncharacterized protein YcgI (DUF1989 family)
MPEPPRRPQDLTPEQLAFYAQVSADQASRTRVYEHYIPKETGHAFPVGVGQVLRITCTDGGQVADFNAFSRTDPAEHFWSGRTRTLQGAHLRVGQRLWSTEPRMRPMFTFITDTVPHTAQPFNAASHDLIYARCSERARAIQTGLPDQPNCNTNLTRALNAIGFPATHVHDAFNVFMTTGIDEHQRLFFVAPEARQGDYVELYAEIDTIVAISCCPGACNGERTKGLGVEVFAHPHRPRQP